MRQGISRFVERTMINRIGRFGRHGGAKILMYHGVTSQQPDHFRNVGGKHVPVGLFRAQLAILRRYRCVVGLTELIHEIRSGRDVSRLAVITLDDGYRNNVATAAAVLSDMKLPATFFLATGYIGERRWFWRDRLEAALAHTRERQVGIPALGPTMSLETDVDRLCALRVLGEAIKKLPAAERDAMTSEVAVHLGQQERRPDGDYEFMSWDEARQLSTCGFEVGAHTVNHAILSRIAVKDAEREILASKQKVEAEVGRCCPVFCYPDGKPSDYSPEIIAICRGHFEAALSTKSGCTDPGELYELRRLAVDASIEEHAMAWLMWKGN